ncbi:hypothetical protein AC1031_007703 [Aphanomyces cochlioides]|nr:hypothetical protein AC1031_007703 [Aphanomyces cochlioides]
MKVNADLSKAALVHHDQITYVPSPSNGVFRGMLDRDGDEVALATTLVRYAPNSKFPAHKHDAGEEFLVLEGTFNDNVGTYPTGTYVRNPIGSIHAPSIGDDGCLILVKLRWMVPEGTGVVVDTTKTSSSNNAWTSLPEGGAVRSLYHNENTGERVWFLHLHAGARVESLDGFEGGEEIFVVDGSTMARRRNCSSTRGSACLPAALPRLFSTTRLTKMYASLSRLVTYAGFYLRPLNTKLSSVTGHITTSGLL